MFSFPKSAKTGFKYKNFEKNKRKKAEKMLEEGRNTARQKTCSLILDSYLSCFSMKNKSDPVKLTKPLLIL